ncbi:Protein Flattop [Larimichthys crocea]|uniref:Protein Flattop n=1 Tax=Larimichthys crocea TaxID=215358 RepID=A0A6G0INE0_LARCR|nr:protein Flattop isoform X2 [Larimichthys crocea]KAE8293035.1 Protein Flattop [Larimichthys crocea]
MSSSYSANQYDSAFKSQRLQNWCETKHFKERPSAQSGRTTFIANDRGHLLPGMVKRGSAWPDFKGTWDLPARIPAHHINPTSRSVEGLKRLTSWGFDPQHTGKSRPHSGSRNTERLLDVGEQTNRDVHHDGAAPSSAAEARPAFKDPPVAGGERTASQNSKDSQADVPGPASQPAEQVTQAAAKDRPLSQFSAAEGKTAVGPASGEGTNSRSSTGRGRPGSNVSEKVASQEAPSSSKQRHRDAQQDQ